MAQAVPGAPISDNTQGLRMPSMQLPSFRRDTVVQDEISEFLERFTYLPAKTSLSLLEQQCVAGDWPRSVLSIAKTTEGYEGKAPEEKLKICIERLRVEFGESKEDKCRRLAAELSAIQQERGESVERSNTRSYCISWRNFAKRLRKIVSPLLFISKVSPNIAQLLVVKASEFETLDKTVEAARRVELSFQTPPTSANASKSLNEWKVTPNAFVSSTAVVKPQLPNQHPQRQQRACYTCGETNHLPRYCPKNRKENSKQPEICRTYNRFLKSKCKEDGNKCKHGQKHQCQFCNKWRCKAIKHPENRPSSTARSTTSDEVDFLRQQLVVLFTRLKRYKSQCQENYSSSNPVGSESQASTSASRLSPPVASDQSSLSTPLFGLPAVIIPAPSAKPVVWK